MLNAQGVFRRLLLQDAERRNISIRVCTDPTYMNRSIMIIVEGRFRFQELLKYYYSQWYRSCADADYKHRFYNVLFPKYVRSH
jgi:hypothetical protein